MPTFPSQPLNPSPLQKSLSSRLRRRPFIYFGLPFLSIVTLASFSLSSFTQTRYDLHNTKVQSVSKEEELRMDKQRKKVDIKEEYYRLQRIGQMEDQSWDQVRVPRPKGVPEWGAPTVGKSELAPVVGQREGDRLV